MKTLLILGAAMAFSLNIFNPLQAADHTKDSIDTVKKNLTDRKAILIDVREDRETDKGYIVGAVLLPLSLLQGGQDDKDFGEILSAQIPKDAIVYTHCAAGVRSLAASEVLAKFNYDVRPLKHGFDDLVQEGFATAKPKK